MKIPYHFNTLPLLALLAAATVADAQVNPQIARRWFEEVTKLCCRQGARPVVGCLTLWPDGDR